MHEVFRMPGTNQYQVRTKSVLIEDIPEVSAERHALPVRVEALLKLPIVQQLDQIFDAEGYELFLVGGAIRDAIQTGTYSDLDFCTDASPDIINKLIDPLGSVWTDGKDFGMVAVQLPQGDKIEICTYRQDIYEPASRNPHIMPGESIQQDLARRDLTVNAMAVNTHTGELVDPFGGRFDLGVRMLRTPKDPLTTVLDDPLRSLRVIRFAACKDMEIDYYLSQAIKNSTKHIDIISQERRRDELLKILAYGSQAVAKAIDLAIEHTLDKYLFGNLNVGDATRKKLREVDTDDVATILGLMIRHTAKDPRKTLLDMKFSLQQTNQVLRAVFISNTIDTLFQAHGDDPVIAVRRIIRFFDDPDINTGLSIADNSSGIQALAHEYNNVQRRQLLRQPLPVNGNHFLEKGVKGPLVGVALSAAENAFLDDPLQIDETYLLEQGAQAAKQAAQAAVPRKRPRVHLG